MQDKKPSERVQEIFDELLKTNPNISNPQKLLPHAIIQYLDEQYENEHPKYIAPEVTFGPSTNQIKE